MAGQLLRRLRGSLAQDGPPDAQRATLRHRRILESNAFLRKVYVNWYRIIRSAAPTGAGAVVEIGSGPGFLRAVLPEAVTSDVFPCPGSDAVINAHALPFAADTLRAIVMTNVFHHLRDPGRFLGEAARCLRRGGRMIAIEPWVTPWSRFVYGHLHHEPFDPDAAWRLDDGDPLFQANNALAWIVFHRDHKRLLLDFPSLRLAAIRPMTPLVYLLSGGMSLRPLMPGWSYTFWRSLEACLLPFVGVSALFALIVVEKVAP